jgi:hypothetical protein
MPRGEVQVGTHFTTSCAKPLRIQHAVAVFQMAAAGDRFVHEFEVVNDSAQGERADAVIALFHVIDDLGRQHDHVLRVFPERANAGMFPRRWTHGRTIGAVCSRCKLCKERANKAGTAAFGRVGFGTSPRVIAKERIARFLALWSTL